ncbi:MAG: serine hydrolase [Anaerolineae bacterium]
MFRLQTRLVKRSASLLILLVLSLMCSNPSVALYTTLYQSTGTETQIQNDAPVTAVLVLDPSQRAESIPLVPETVTQPAKIKHSVRNTANIAGYLWWTAWPGSDKETSSTAPLSTMAGALPETAPSLDYDQLSSELVSMAAGGPERLATFNARWQSGYRTAFFSRVTRTAGIELIAPKPPAELTMQAPDDDTRAKMERAIQAVDAIITPLKGDYAVYFQALGSDAHFGLNAQMNLTAASLIKMPVLAALYREADAGRVNLETVYTLTVTDIYEGSGVLINQPAGTQYTYRDLAGLMGEFSDNTAFHYIADQVLGADLVQATITLLGMTRTNFVERVTTAEDMGQFFARLYQEPVVSDGARQEILSFITDTAYEDRIPAGIPNGIVVSHKIGSQPGIISDAGIVFSSKPFVLVIMTEHVSVMQALRALPQIANAIYTAWEG